MLQKKCAMSFLVAAFLFASCRNTRLIEKNETVKVNAVAVKKEVLSESIKSIGSLSYKSKHSISSLVSGRMEAVYVKEGDAVTNGQVLGKLRNLQLETQKETLENSLSEAEASLLTAEDNLRVEKLNIVKRMKNLEKLKLQIEQTEKEYDYKNNCLMNNKELCKIGALTELSVREEELNLNQLKTSLELMKKEYEISSIGFREEDILDLGYQIPESDKEMQALLVSINSRQAVNAVKQESSRVDSVRKNLMSIMNLMEELNVRSTVNGIVASCKYETGDHVSENETCFIVFNASILNAVFYVQEQEIWMYKGKQKIQITIPSLNEYFECIVSEISPAADPVTGNFCVKVEISNDKNELKPGMFASCSLSTGENLEFCVIPESSIMYQNHEAPVVLYLADNHVFYKKISIHCQKNGLAFIKSGLKENDLIVDKPSIMIKEGDCVEVL